MKFEMQIQALEAYARLSGRSKIPVDAKDLGHALGISAATAPLCNGFFLDSNWIERKSKGSYVTSDTLLEYFQEKQLGGAEPARSLRDPARLSWYWQTIEPLLTMAPISMSDAVYHLSKAADAGPDHKPQIINLILWMEYAGLIDIDGDEIRAKADQSDDISLPTTDGDNPEEKPSEPADPDPAQRPADAKVSKPTTQRGPEPPAVLALGWNLRLTAIDLAKFSPGQIAALFEAVGKVAAITSEVKP